MNEEACYTCGDPTTDIEVLIERTAGGAVSIVHRFCSHGCLADHAASCAREDDDPVTATQMDAALAVMRMGSGRAWNGAPVDDGVLSVGGDE